MDIVSKIDRMLLEKDSAYQTFFNKKLKAYGVSSQAELKGDEKKKFFDEIEKEWTKDKD